MAPALLAAWIASACVGQTAALAAPAPLPAPPPIDARRAILDPNRTRFPRSSLIDFSYLLDPPAGRHGFLQTTPDGHFRFQDGTPVRFWGINIAKDSVFQPHETIATAADRIAQAGFNLVRLHHVDDVGGLLPAHETPDGRLNQNGLDALDYWIAQCRERGIYVYLDLLDYRTFQPWEGVPNGDRLGRGAKPYALFDDRLIELQRDYARSLLCDHVNPYTGLPYVRDPAVCLVELCDENGLVKRWRDLPSLVEPYATQLRQQWNSWLRTTYTDTAGLAREWPDRRPDERIEDATVRLPEHEPKSPLERNRRRDFLRFAYAVHRQYFRDLLTPLQERGLRVPVTAVLDSDALPDVRAAADGLDFLATNFYWDHPFYGAGQDWQLPAYYFNLNELQCRGADTFAPFVSIASALGKPLVVREWNWCWPNKHRAAGMLEAAAYARLMDVAGMICFTYDARPQARGIGFFDVRRDPCRWGLLGVAARLYLGGDLDPGAHTVGVGCCRADTFYGGTDPRRDMQRRMADDLYSLGWLFPVRNVFFGERLSERPDADLIVASGLTPVGRYDVPRAVLHVDANACHPPQDAAALLAHTNGYGVAAGQPGLYRFTFSDFLYARRTQIERSAPPFVLDSVRGREYDPIGVDAAANACLGFVDARNERWVFSHLERRESPRAALDALAALYGHASRVCLDTRAFAAPDGRLVRDERRGLLRVDAPQLQALAGSMAPGVPMATSQVRLVTDTSIGALAVVSFDGRPLADSQHYLVKFVSFATNSGERKAEHGRDQWRGAIYALSAVGSAPVLTHGVAVQEPAVVSLGSRPVVEAHLRNGTWEVVRQGDTYHLYCDTPGAAFGLPDLPATVWVAPNGPAGRGAASRQQQPLVVPEAAFSLEITPVPEP